MKTLNKTLSLVLVLVMVLGLVGVAGAAFTDTADVKYTEAVDVMTGIGAINGYTDGTIKPTATITREEAAKLVCFAILGKDVAEKLNVGATGFSDVDAGRWSAPYISYLVGEGIIAGMGDGTFAPTANVTGYQFMKMMLCAAGYGANGEFTGAGWELAVAVAAGKCKITENATGVDYTKAATREEAMLYAFNGILVPQVEYNKAFATYLGKGQGVGSTKGSSIAQELYKYNDAYPDNLTSPISGCKLKVVAAVEDGVVGYKWEYNGKAVTGFVSDSKVLATSNDGTAFAKLVDNTKTEYVGYEAEATVAVYLNGTRAIPAQATGTLATYYAAVDGVKAAARGVIYSFIDTDSNGKYNIVSITADQVCKVAADTVTTTSGTVTKVTVSGATDGTYAVSEIDSKYVTGYEGLKKDDYVTVHTYLNTDSNRCYVITKCGTFTGTMQAYNTYNSAATVDGKVYKVSGLTGTVAPATSLAGKEGTTFYTDAAGFVVAAVAGNAAVSLSNTLLIKDTYPVTLGEFKAKAVFGDTSSAIITISKVDSTKMTSTLWDATWYKAANIETPTDDPTTPYNYHGLEAFTYVKNTDGSYNLTSVTDQTKAFVGGVTKGTAQFATCANVGFSSKTQAQIQSYLATASTMFIYNDAANDKIATYVGIANAPTVKPAAYATTNVNFLFDSNGYATIVVVNYTGGSSDLNQTSANKDYVFAVSKGTRYFDSTNGDYYTYDAVVNGEIKTITGVYTAADEINAKGEMIAGNLYAVTSYDGKHVFERTAVAGATNLLATISGTAKRFAVNGTTVSYYDATAAGNLVNSFVVSSDVKCFFYDSANRTIKALTLAEVATKANSTGYTLAGVKVSDTDSNIAQLFVIG